MLKIEDKINLIGIYSEFFITFERVVRKLVEKEAKINVDGLYAKKQTREGEIKIGFNLVGAVIDLKVLGYIMPKHFIVARWRKDRNSLSHEGIKYFDKEAKNIIANIDELYSFCQGTLILYADVLEEEGKSVETVKIYSIYEDIRKNIKK